MDTTRFLKGFITALVIFIAGDILWHNVLLGDFYITHLAAVGGAPPQGFPPFIIAFEVIAAAIVTYFVNAAARTKTVGEGAWHGALLGLAMVSAINFVNHTLLPQWDTTLVAVDTAWGVVLGAIAGAAIILVAGKKV